MYGIQVISSESGSFDCISYLNNDYGEWFGAIKSRSKDGKYVVKHLRNKRKAVSDLSYADALHNLFPDVEYPNLTETGRVIPCTPSECHGRDIFKVWASGNKVIIEALERDDKKRYVVIDESHALTQLKNPSVWYGLYERNGYFLNLVISSPGRHRMGGHLQVCENGIRYAGYAHDKDDSLVMKYKTLAGLLMGV